MGRRPDPELSTTKTKRMIGERPDLKRPASSQVQCARCGKLIISYELDENGSPMCPSHKESK